VKPSLLVISPHLDDAVLSCGRAIAAHPGACVVTLFAGLPDAGMEQTPWDAECGFRNGDQAIRVRREEDAAALSAIGATPRWLEYRDSQYGGNDSVAVLANALHGIIAERTDWTVLLPLGLDHPDHRRTREAALATWRIGAAARAWLLYEDVPYRARPGAARAVLQNLGATGLVLAQERLPSAPVARKVRAVSRYRSQLRALIAGHGIRFTSVLRRERYWRLA
jgi:LmbE family N-acetylglucosaminyl deacetylase